MFPYSRNGKSEEKLIAIMVDRESIKYLSFNSIIFMKNFIHENTIFHGKSSLWLACLHSKQIFVAIVPLYFVVVAIETFCVPGMLTM